MQAEHAVGLFSTNGIVWCLKQLMSKAAFTLMLIVVLGCSGEEGRIRRLASKYRDTWLADIPTNSPSALKETRIESVSHTAGIWQVTFVAHERFVVSGTPQTRAFYLYIYLDDSGALKKVVPSVDEMKSGSAYRIVPMPSQTNLIGGASPP